MPAKLSYAKVAVPGGEIGYVKCGSGKPLVLITRYAATLYNWDAELIFGLAQSFTLYLLDSRLVGHTHTQNSADICGYVADMVQAIEALHLEQPIVLGWSFGGVAVQRLYKAYAQNMSGLVLLSSFPDPRLANTEFSQLSMTTDSELSDTDKLKLYRLMVSEMPAEAHSNLLKESVLHIENYHYRYTKAAKELHNLIVESAPATTPAELAAISVPTLILNARNDMTFPPDARETMFNHIPNSKLIVYASGGHLLIQHHGAEIASDITTFFKRSQK